MLYVGVKVKQKAKFYVCRNFGQAVGHSIESLLTCFVAREEGCVVQ